MTRMNTAAPDVETAQADRLTRAEALIRDTEHTDGTIRQDKSSIRRVAASGDSRSPASAGKSCGERIACGLFLASIAMLIAGFLVTTPPSAAVGKGADAIERPKGNGAEIELPPSWENGISEGKGAAAIERPKGNGAEQTQKPKCSKAWNGSLEDDCSATKCCEAPGLSCYEKWMGISGCVETCELADGWTCRKPPDVVPFTEIANLHAHSKRTLRSGVTLYCFSVYTHDTGSSNETSHELSLLQKQYEMKVSIFDCDYYDVFSDVTEQIGSGYQTIQVHDASHEFHMVKKKETGRWVSTGMYKQVWKATRGRIGLERADWVVKVEVDTVFIPIRLKTRLLAENLTSIDENFTSPNVYFETCREVDWGFFSSFEVFSIQAFNTLVTNLDKCSKNVNWVSPGWGPEWGPIDEDTFAQMCMDDHGVPKMMDFQHLIADATCRLERKWWHEKDNMTWTPPCIRTSSPAMHPFKTPQEYFNCLEATLLVEWQAEGEMF